MTLPRAAPHSPIPSTPAYSGGTDVRVQRKDVCIQRESEASQTKISNTGQFQCLTGARGSASKPGTSFLGSAARIQHILDHIPKRGDEGRVSDKSRWAAQRNLDHAGRRAEIARRHRGQSVSGMGIFPADPHPASRDSLPRDLTDDEDPAELPRGADMCGGESRGSS